MAEPVQQYVALIRGINVGRAKRVAMADLRAMIEGLGYSGVRTLLNSGNAIFSGGGKPTEAATLLEEGLESEIGVAARITVLTADEVNEAVAENPLLDIANDPTRLLVAVLADPTDRAKLKPLLKEPWSPDALALGRRVAYLWCPRGQLESKLPAAVGKQLGDGVTTRNWATMLKLQTLLEKAGRSGG